MCPWFIEVSSEYVVLVDVLLFASAWASTLTLALAALDLDMHANSTVKDNVARSACYALCHVALRASEITFRLNMSVLVCEFVRNLPFVHSKLRGMAVMFLPFVAA